MFAELKLDGTLAGRYQLEFQRRVEQDGVEIVPVAIKVRDLTSEEGAEIIGGDAAGKAAEVLAFNAQVVSLREEIENLTASTKAEIDGLKTRLAAAVDALRKVAEADTAWDTTPRNSVIAVLEKEA
jgi:hypothetical protein